VSSTGKVYVERYDEIAEIPSSFTESRAPRPLVQFATQANTISIEWEFGDGTTATVTSDQYQTSEVTHQFTKSGVFEVSEKIHTDDLATPELLVHSKVDIAG